jgi:hypothetical protein
MLVLIGGLLAVGALTPTTGAQPTCPGDTDIRLDDGSPVPHGMPVCVNPRDLTDPVYPCFELIISGDAVPDIDTTPLP